MTILRIEPGDRAWKDGWYVLVGHYGESTDYAVWRVAGEVLPPITTTSDLGPFWYVRMDEAYELARVG